MRKFLVVAVVFAVFATVTAPVLAHDPETVTKTIPS